jgi:hypothetical protein
VYVCFSKLLGLEVEEEVGARRLRAVPPLRPEAMDIAANKDAYLWLCFW